MSEDREELDRLVRMGVEALDAYEPAALVLSPRARLAAPEGAHNPDTCECCQARWRPRVVRILAGLTPSFVAGAAICAASAVLLANAGEVAAPLVR